jgi:hypothetical protein
MRVLLGLGVLDESYSAKPAQRSSRAGPPGYIGLGLGTKFRSEKILRNRLGTVSVISRKKVLIPRHSEFRGRANSEVRNGTELRKTVLLLLCLTGALLLNGHG